MIKVQMRAKTNKVVFACAFAIAGMSVGLVGATCFGTGGVRENAERAVEVWQGNQRSVTSESVTGFTGSVRAIG